MDQRTKIKQVANGLTFNAIWSHAGLQPVSLSWTVESNHNKKHKASHSLQWESEFPLNARSDHRVFLKMKLQVATGLPFHQSRAQKLARPMLLRKVAMKSAHPGISQQRPRKKRLFSLLKPISIQLTDHRVGLNAFTLSVLSNRVKPL